MGKRTKRIYSFFGSKKLSWAILIIFIFEASWIALSAIYPQAFDENFHFGLIKMYTHYWFPFLSKQPANAAAYGAVARDPSFLYHYLMSFPYRFINIFTHSQITQVIILRFIDIAFFASALVLFKKILKRVGLSDQLNNLILFLFILIPVVPQLAGQINYDDLLLPLIALSCWLTFDLIDQINARKPKISTVLYLAILCLSATLVKYEFGPIFLTIVLYLGYLVYVNYRSSFNKLWSQLYLSWKKQNLILRLALIILFIFVSGMFVERDVYNLYKFHAVNPNCTQVLTTKECNQYSVWSTDNSRHQYIIDHPGTYFMNPIKYLGAWIYWMWYRLFFAVNGVNSFTNYPPLPLPVAASGIIFIFAIYSIIRFRRKIFIRHPYLEFLALVSFIYTAILFFEGYEIYRYTATEELMNGRYLLPVVIFIAAIAGTAFSISLKSSTSKKIFLAIAVLLLFLEGGGFLTFIARSDSTWYWNNPTVLRVNQAAQKITNKVIVKGNKTYTTSDWFFN